MPTWIRLRDTTTGHHFDASERRAAQLIERGRAERVLDHPTYVGAVARPPKPQRTLRSLTPQSAEPAEDAAPEHPEEEA